ncbi:hypothetical protein EUTSA_v10029443mg [Eutrema salsugineum]|uniref:Uncharacterized protein n=1 Tax=Eutrema salsugineum TaxID=72664 RepID=V4L4W6_EUTSA|nr:hypothetical protein EUTSA_v10029443mg [Eutrema salsugineum]
MEKTSLKLVFLFSFTVIAFYMNCIGSKCPEGKKNCNYLSQVAPIMESTGVCEHDNDCKKYCPPECKSKKRTCVRACNGGHCFCQC